MLRELETNENEHGGDVKCLSETINLLPVETTQTIQKKGKQKKKKKDKYKMGKKDDTFAINSRKQWTITIAVCR